MQQFQGQKELEARRQILRRYDQRNMSDENSAHASLVNNFWDRHWAKDVAHFDDVLRTFTNGTNKYESRFGKIRDEEKTVAAKKLMPESPVNFWFRGATMNCDALITALENIAFTKS